jgi:putative effector of murein hydrolase
MLTTAGSVVGVGKWMKKEINGASNEEILIPEVPKDESIDDFESAMPEAPVPAPKPFSDDLMKSLRITAIFSGIVALEAASPSFTTAPARLLTKYQNPIVSLLLGSTTLASFVFGARLPAKFKKVVHPLVTCTTLTWAVMGVFGKVVEKSFSSLLTTYKMGKGFNGIFGTGAGDILLFLLGPAVMSLAISMYDKRELIRDNFAQIATAVSVSSLGGLFGTAWLVRWMGLVQPSFRVALLSRNITSPLAMAIAGLFGASAATVSIAVSIVVVTGLFGANFGAASLTAVGIKNPVARGMGIGAAAHGLGTAAFVEEKDAFPFSAISMALTATACTCLVSLPAVKKLVLSIALGGAV